MRIVEFVKEKPRTSAEILDHMKGQFRVSAAMIQDLRRSGHIKFDRQARRWKIS